MPTCVGGREERAIQSYFLFESHTSLCRSHGTGGGICFDVRGPDRRRRARKGGVGFKREGRLNRSARFTNARISSDSFSSFTRSFRIWSSNSPTPVPRLPTPPEPAAATSCLPTRLSRLAAALDYKRFFGGRQTTPAVFSPPNGGV